MRTLQGRILAFFLVLLVLVVAVTLFTVYRATYAHTERQVEAELDQGRRILLDRLNTRQQSLRAAAETLAKDDALRQAIFEEGDDRESLLVALDNHRRRTAADLALLLELDGTILAGAGDASLAGSDLALPAVETASAGDELHVATVGGRAIQLAAVPYYVPVSAPEPSFRLVLGQRIDDDLAEELTDLTGLHVAVLRISGEGAIVEASSLPDELRDALASDGFEPDADGGAEIGGVEMLVSSSSIPTLDGLPIRALLLRSAREAFLDFRQLSASIVGIILTFVLMVILGAVLIARGITRPLRSLGRAARQIARGDYGADLPEERGDEVGELAQELGRMQREIRSREEAIEHLAYHDDLTGLPNRNRFRARLAEAIAATDRQLGRLAVAVLDLDGFKDINDTLGHHVGDRLLLEIGARLRSLGEEEGIDVARLGGDEFGALLRGVGIGEAREAAERLRRRLAAPVEVDDIQLEAQASVGVAVFPEHGGDPTSLLRQAEVAMYVAKERWLGVSFYETSEDRHSVQRLSLMSDLRKAVEDGGLHLEYQPKLDLVSGAVGQVEALVRWHHPRLGPVSPGEFVPIAEQTGAVRHLTRWVLREVIRQLAIWRDEEIDLDVAVNLSTRDLHDREFPSWLAEHLVVVGVSADRLVLEVTESSVMADPVTARGILEELSSMGVTLSIDDFGTGYSSLAQLQRLPVQELKVDRAFVLDMARSEEAFLIVRSTVDLGHGLGLRIVGEGVETAETLELLRKIGCDMAQGYHVGMPLDPGALVRRLTAVSEAGG